MSRLLFLRKALQIKIILFTVYSFEKVRRVCLWKAKNDGAKIHGNKAVSLRLGSSLLSRPVQRKNAKDMENDLRGKEYKKHSGNRGFADIMENNSFQAK